MITNSQDFIFYSDFKYPPVKLSGSTPVAANDSSSKVLASGVTIDNDYAVYVERVLSADNQTIIERATNPYIDPSGNLMYMPPYTPCTIHWRIYGY